jgi:hypothetical protein
MRLNGLPEVPTSTMNSSLAFITRKNPAALLGHLGLICLLLILSACATPPASDQERADLTQYSTFALATVSRRGPASDPGAGVRLAKPAREALIAVLTGKGYVQAPIETADLLVKPLTEFSPDPFSEASEQRKLTIKIYDNHTNKLLWSGFRARSTTQSATPDEARLMIQQILAPLPSVSDLPTQ